MSEPISFDGRVAIVTGAGGKVGRGYARELARRGARVVVNDVGGDVHGSGGSQRAADRVVEEIIAAGGEAASVEDIAAHLQEIRSTEGYEIYSSIAEELGLMAKLLEGGEG